MTTPTLRDNERYYESVRIPNPGAGNVATYKIPGETWTKVDVVRFQLTASAAVANRYVSVDILDGDGVPIYRAMTPNVLTAAVVRAFTFATNVDQFSTSAGLDDMGPMTDIVLPPGFRVRITASGLDVGDAFTAINLYVCRYPSADWAPSPGGTPYIG